MHLMEEVANGYHNPKSPRHSKNCSRPCLSDGLKKLSNVSDSLRRLDFTSVEEEEQTRPANCHIKRSRNEVSYQHQNSFSDLMPETTNSLAHSIESKTAPQMVNQFIPMEQVETDKPQFLKSVPFSNLDFVVTPKRIQFVSEEFGSDPSVDDSNFQKDEELKQFSPLYTFDTSLCDDVEQSLFADSISPELTSESTFNDFAADSANSEEHTFKTPLLRYQRSLEIPSTCSTALNTTTVVTPPSENQKKIKSTTLPLLDKRKLSFSTASRIDTPVESSLNESFYTVPETPVRNSIAPPPTARKLNNRLIRQSSLGLTKVLVSFGEGEPNKRKLVEKEVEPFFDNFVILRTIGSGEFSEVFLVRDRINGNKYAVKKSKHQFRSKKDRAKYMREVSMYKAMISDYDHVVKYYSAWQEDGYFYLQMELCQLGSLQGLLDKVGEYNGIIELGVWKCVRDIALGLKHLHSHGLVHMDIKPENIFLCETGSLKIGDLGLCCEIGSIDDGGEGDIVYAALESIQGASRMPSADMFSFGLVILRLSTNIPLPRGGYEWQELRHGRVKSYTGMRSLVELLIRENPVERATAEDILQITQKRDFIRDNAAWFNTYVKPVIDSLYS